MFELYLQCSICFQRQPAKTWWEIPHYEWGNWDFSVTLLFEQQQWHQLSLVNSEQSFTWNTCIFSQREKGREDKLVTSREMKCGLQLQAQIVATDHWIHGIIKTVFAIMTLECNYCFCKEVSWCFFFSLPHECSEIINNCSFSAKYISDTICHGHKFKQKRYIRDFWISYQIQI